MSAYFVVYLNVTDPDRFKEYFQSVMPVSERRGGRLIAQGTPEIIEGTLLSKQAENLYLQVAREFILEHLKQKIGSDSHDWLPVNA